MPLASSGVTPRTGGTTTTPRTARRAPASATALGRSPAKTTSRTGAPSTSRTTPRPGTARCGTPAAGNALAEAHHAARFWREHANPALTSPDPGAAVRPAPQPPVLVEEPTPRTPLRAPCRDIASNSNTPSSPAPAIAGSCAVPRDDAAANDVWCSESLAAELELLRQVPARHRSSTRSHSPGRREASHTDVVMNSAPGACAPPAESGPNAPRGGDFGASSSCFLLHSPSQPSSPLMGAAHTTGVENAPPAALAPAASASERTELVELSCVDAPPPRSPHERNAPDSGTATRSGHQETTAVMTAEEATALSAPYGFTPCLGPAPVAAAAAGTFVSPLACREKEVPDEVRATPPAEAGANSSGTTDGLRTIDSTATPLRRAQSTSCRRTPPEEVTPPIDPTGVNEAVAVPATPDESPVFQYEPSECTPQGPARSGGDATAVNLFASPGIGTANDASLEFVAETHEAVTPRSATARDRDTVDVDATPAAAPAAAPAAGPGAACSEVTPSSTKTPADRSALEAAPSPSPSCAGAPPTPRGSPGPAASPAPTGPDFSAAHVDADAGDLSATGPSPHVAAPNRAAQATLPVAPQIVEAVHGAPEGRVRDGGCCIVA